uniref:Cytochrome b5 heme-binding domain-containing protein n=1 Tax=Odontella aurita TaxID=265563 RepID=A0A7S4IY37_9STRA|mmetsp:Transcript_3284/g.8474  ORF Transcript_3284/g.8474 Transcript_3284/m.8474 type:complete len:308 (+) Transcript_3284:183-1106(+)
MRHTQCAYDALFTDLAITLRSEPGGWETRQEEPPAAYLHVSRAGWNDANLNGIHLEAYVLSGQLRARAAVVALHCENFWPAQFRERFVRVITERAGATIEGWNREMERGTVGNFGRWEVKGPTGMSVCEVKVPFGSSPRETVVRVTAQLRRLQTLAGLIDEVIAHCEDQVELNVGAAPAGVGAAMTDAATSNKKVPLQISEQDVTRSNGRDGRPLWVVIDGYVVDASNFADGHPGGLKKILSANDASTGWTGKAFGFSLSTGANAHYPMTGKTFREGVARFESLGRTERVDVNYSSYGAITILGKLV